MSGAALTFVISRSSVKPTSMSISISISMSAIVESGQVVDNRVGLRVVDIQSLVVGYIRGSGAVERILDS
jgi:TATA-binding protein-associated factor Taf7